MEYIGKFIVWLIGIVISTILQGIVFSSLWKWFVVSIFEVKELSIGQAIGLSFFLSCVIMKRKDIDNEEKHWSEPILYSIVINLTMWGMGYIVYKLIS